MTAAFTPPPVLASTSANAAGQRQLRGSRRPRWIARSIQGSAAYASSAMLVRFAYTAT